MKTLLTLVYHTHINFHFFCTFFNGNFGWNYWSANLDKNSRKICIVSFLAKSIKCIWEQLSDTIDDLHEIKLLDKEEDLMRSFGIKPKKLEFIFKAFMLLPFLKNCMFQIYHYLFKHVFRRHSLYSSWHLHSNTTFSSALFVCLLLWEGPKLFKNTVSSPLSL